MIKARRGFTIVELLIVIVVVGVLAAIGIVSYSQVQKLAKNSSLVSDLNHTAKTIHMWLVKPGNTVSHLRQIYDGTGALWIAGDKAVHELDAAGAKYWNDNAHLPDIQVTPWTTLEVIVRYGGAGDEVADANNRMIQNNQFCLSAVAPGSSYDYRPMTYIHADYNKILFYDSALGGVYSLEELGEKYDSGQEIICIQHLLWWRNATA